MKLQLERLSGNPGRTVSLRKFQETDSRMRKVSSRKTYPELHKDKRKIESVGIVHKKPNTDFN